MGDRITFRERTNGVAIDSYGEGVTICEPRIGYAKGQITTGVPSEGYVACGPGTRYPMIVTRKQLEELLYLVRDSTVSGGYVSISHDATGGGIDYTGTEYIEFKGGARPTNMAEKTTGISYSDLRTPPASRNASKTTQRAANSISLGGSSDGTNFTTSRGGAFGDLYYFDTSGSGDQARDPISERALWTIRTDDNDGVFPYYRLPSFLEITEFLPSGMSFYMLGVITDGSTSDVLGSYYGYHSRGTFTATVPGNPSSPLNETKSYYGSGSARLAIENLVAYVGGDHPFAPGVTLFLKVRFDCFSFVRYSSYFTGPQFGVTSLNEPEDPDYQETSANLRLVLAEEEILVPLYFYHTNTSGTITLVSVSDFTVTADKWWPYKTSTGADAWDTTTGKPASGGPGA